MDTTTHDTLDDFIARHKIRVTVEQVDTRPDGLWEFAERKWFDRARHFRCTLHAHRHRFMIYFSQGSAHTNPPTVAEILDSLAMDASSTHGCFEDFCDELGYDHDSLKAYAAWQACNQTRVRLIRMFGEDDYETLAYGMERL